ncbi:DNA repair protein RecO [Aquabacter cavernae]|uniref:DNA repair protein RecO n=1 Tax=Aquabacter cavernae TaxID=2496029 RepID=UPI000F8EB2B8|nr:DNA repair protein RecO [Aquabacter cavernae]
MEWSDEALVTGVRRHGEASAIVELLTFTRGRHMGLVRGAFSRRLAPWLQPGNTLHVTWRARLEDQLGTFSVEPLALRAEALMRLAHAAFGVSHMASLIRLLPERDPHPALYRVCQTILDTFEDPRDAAILMARLELALLSELGFGLDLETCAATGGREDLIYVSPRSGRAVSAQAGAPYADRLLPLPTFLLATQIRPTADEIAEAFRLTGHFLSRHIMEPRGFALSDARAAFIASVARQAQ